MNAASRKYLARSILPISLGAGFAVTGFLAARETYHSVELNGLLRNDNITRAQVAEKAQSIFSATGYSEICEEEARLVTRKPTEKQIRQSDQNFVNCMRQEFPKNPLGSGKLLPVTLVGALVGFLRLRRGAAYILLANDARKGKNGAFRLGGDTALADPEETATSDDETVQFEIKEGPTPYATVTLKKGDIVYSERGSFLAKGNGIEFITKTGAEGDDAQGRFKRVMSGEGILTLKFQNVSDEPQQLVLNPSKGGNITKIDLTKIKEIFCANGAFFASSNAVDIGFKKIGNLSFTALGGQGLTMQSIKLKDKKPASVLIASPGQVMERQLSPGEKMHLQKDALLALTGDVTLSLHEINRSFTAIASGEGRFLTAVEGPGTIWIRSVVKDPKKNSLTSRLLGLD